jgi:signal recognition particle receptor subunit beta
MVFNTTEPAQAVKLNTSIQVLRIIVIGLPETGKSTFVKTISQSTVWDGVESQGWLSGQLTVDENLLVYFLEPPEMKNFDFMWLRELIVDAEADGFVVLMDSSQPDYFGGVVSIIQTIRANHPDVPIVTATTRQDDPHAWSADDIRVGLRFPKEIPVLPCVCYDAKMVKEVVLQLLYKIFNM